MFQVKTVYDEDDLMMLCRVNRWPKDGGRKHPILKKIGLAVGILLVLYLLLSMLIGAICEIRSSLSNGYVAYLSKNSVGIVFWLAIGFSLILHNSERIWKKSVWKNYKEKGVQLSFCFSDSAFTVDLPTCSSEILYSGLSRLYESADRYALMLPTNAGYVLPKSAFTRGDPEAFRDFIRQNTGKPVVFIK